MGRPSNLRLRRSYSRRRSARASRALRCLHWKSSAHPITVRCRPSGGSAASSLKEAEVRLRKAPRFLRRRRDSAALAARNSLAGTRTWTSRSPLVRAPRMAVPPTCWMSAAGSRRERSSRSASNARRARVKVSREAEKRTSGAGRFVKAASAGRSLSPPSCVPFGGSACARRRAAQGSSSSAPRVHTPTAPGVGQRVEQPVGCGAQEEDDEGRRGARRRTRGAPRLLGLLPSPGPFRGVYRISHPHAMLLGWLAAPS